MRTCFFVVSNLFIYYIFKFKNTIIVALKYQSLGLGNILTLNLFFANNKTFL